MYPWLDSMNLDIQVSQLFLVVTFNWMERWVLKEF